MQDILLTYVFIGFVFSLYSMIRTKSRKSTEHPVGAVIVGSFVWPMFLIAYLVDEDSILRADIKLVKNKFVKLLKK